MIASDLTHHSLWVIGTENILGSAVDQARAELSALFPVVDTDQREEWTDFATDRLKEWTHFGHRHRFGSLDMLTNESDYIPDMLTPERGADGVLRFVPDENIWEEYWPMWLYSPVPRR